MRRLGAVCPWAENMEETKQKLKAYRETLFWSHLNGGRALLPHIAVNENL